MTPEEKRAYHRAWYEKNKDHARAQQRAWYAANKDRVAATRRKWYEANKEKVLAAGKAWKAANPEKHKESSRRSMRRAAGMLNPTSERRTGKCPVCLRGPQELHCDHDHATGQIRGWLCRRCNPALGLLNDSVEAMQRAIAYINGHRGSETNAASPTPAEAVEK